MNTDKTKLVSNFLSLGLQQGIILISPLIIFPYLLRVLGVYGFGVFALIQTAVMYFDLLIAFGLNLTATKLIAKCYGNKEEERKIIFSVYYIKLLLFFISILCLSICYFFIPYLQQNILLILYSALYLLGNLLFPDWYFQGIQQMKNCTIVTLVSKLASLLLIFILVKQQNDISITFLCLAIGNVMAGMVGLVLLNIKVKAWYKNYSSIFPKQLFIESGYVFTSIILTPFYSSINLFILQLFYNPLIVGAYAIAQKIFSASSMLINLANTTLFPYFTQLYSKSVKAYRQRVKKTLFILLISFTIISLILYLFAKKIILLLLGNSSNEDISTIVTLLRIMSFALLFSPFVSFFFQQMIILNKKKEAIKNIIITVIINLIISIVLAYKFAAIGITIGMCITTLLICFLHFYSIRKQLFA